MAKDTLCLCFALIVISLYQTIISRHSPNLKPWREGLKKDPELRERYAETIREYIRKGYVVAVEPHDPRKRSDRESYLPHHPVVNPNRPGKVRQVLNEATKFHGTSLNKSLLVGPDLLQNLIFVLLRFRQHKYAVSADIEGMFLQVGVLARDQISLRFLWREDTTSNVVVYSPYIRRTGFAYVRQFRFAKNSN